MYYILVKYIIPILLLVIWIGGLNEILSEANFEFLAISAILLAILLMNKKTMKRQIT